MSRVWRKVRVVVEVPVRGEYGERDLSWDVRQCLDERMSTRHRRHISQGVRFGRMEVKELGRVVEHAYRELLERRRDQTQGQLDKIKIRIKKVQPL